MIPPPSPIPIIVGARHIAEHMNEYPKWVIALLMGVCVVGMGISIWIIGIAIGWW